jgi:SAM-dependent methyltransferase
MRERTYEDEGYWDRIYALREPPDKERVTLDGNDGEEEFDDRILKAVVDKDVLDIGCGDGSFTFEVSRRARRVTGVDFSAEALARAVRDRSIAKQKNIRLQQADAKSLPFADSEFDVAVSRRGPATATMKTLFEAYRVLKPNGLLMEITIGEKNCENLTRIFGRGQMFGVREMVLITKKKMLKEAGFREIQAREYTATEIFPGMKRLIIRLNDSPIIPEFEPKKDERFLAAVEEQCRTSRGIETPVHRVTIIAKK